MVRISVLAGLDIRAVVVQLPAHFPVQAEGVLELVLESDDAARGLDGSSLVDELTGAGGDAQLAAGVPAVAAFRNAGE